MKSPLIRLSLACNDHRNGVFAGLASSIEVCDCRFESPYWNRHLRCEIGDVSFTLGRRKRWPHHGERRWYGNWCWNALWVTPRVVVEVVNFALTKGYRFDVATEPFLGHCDGQPWVLELVEKWLIGKQAEQAKPD